MRTVSTQQVAGLYPISTVASQTGVNPVTLRAWERRYGLVKPHRTPKGHRLYTAKDIEQIHEILRLVEEGVPISRVNEALRLQTAPPDISAHIEADVWQDYLQRMVSAISDFEETNLEQVYNVAMSLYPVDVVTRRLLVPLLYTLGERWQSVVGSIAEEHFFSVYMRNKLGARFHHRQANISGSKLVAACLTGEFHELGLLLLALAAHDRGYQLVLLGANMPLAELPLVVQRTDAQALVLSSSVDPDAEVLNQGLPELVRSTNVPVFIGGTTAVRHRDAIAAAGAHAIGHDLVLGLKQMGQALRSQIKS